QDFHVTGVQSCALPIWIRGWKENPDTPFWSVEQGESKDYFYRATAIKYVRPPAGEPVPAARKTASAPIVTQSSPLIDTNQLLKLARKSVVQGKKVRMKG